MNPLELNLEDVANPGVTPLVILILMFVALFFLWRSMRRMMSTIDPDLPRQADLDAERDEAERNPAKGSAEGILAGRGKGVQSPTSPDL